jgi:membrane-associated phospholipid phosphatase
VIALPFYFLFPVKEMWAGNPEKVRLLVDLVSPAVMEAYRANSALDNCFPSLHTSLALTVAIVASRGEGRRAAAVLWILAVAVVLSTLHLGIHWLTDIGAGIVLAIALGRRLSAIFLDTQTASDTK